MAGFPGVRHTKSNPCVICGGHEALPQGKGIRCAGFRNGKYVHCTREQFKGDLELDETTNPPTFAHYMAGECRCGVEHGRADSWAAKSGLAGSRGSGGRPGTFSAEWGRTPRFEWTYRHPVTGAAIAVHGRFEKDAEGGGKRPKTYRWRMPEGGYGDGLVGIGSYDPPPLYAEELLMLGVGEPVCVCEGEPACDAVKAAGMFATTWPGGSGQKEFRPEWLELFRGRLVYLWPDNDPPGASHMAALRAALGGIAKQAIYIGPVGGPHDDAVDYFAKRGTLADRLADVLPKPEVKIRGADHVQVRQGGPMGKVTFTFDALTSDRRGLSANLTVGVEGHDHEWEGDLSLASVSMRETVRRQLEGLFGKPQEEKDMWIAMVNAAWSLAKRAWQSIDRSIGIAEMQDDRDTPWVVESLVLERASVVFFGRGSSLKSYFTDALVLAVAFGAPEFCGFRVFRQAPVLVIDYEDPGAMRLRMKRLLKGMDFDEQFLDDLPIRVFPPNGAPVASLVDQIEATAQKMYEQLGSRPMLVVDSAMPACDGEPEKSGPVLAFFRALNRLDLATVIISHVGWGEMEKGGAQVTRPYGFVGWENLPRRTFSFRRTDDTDADDIATRIRNEKANGKKSPPLTVDFHFEGSNGPVKVERRVGKVTPFEDEVPVVDQVKKVLSKASKRMTKYEIQERCAGTPTVTGVQTALTTGRKEGWAVIDEGGRGHSQTFYVWGPQQRMRE